MPLIRYALLAFALTAATPSAAVDRVDVSMANFKFTPATIHLKHGQQYVLHLSSTGAHSFSAKAFFAAATIPAADRARIADGKIEVGAGQSVDIHLTAPAAGSYEIHCTHFLHASQGMKGSFVVS
jgi:plastocyanin